MSPSSDKTPLERLLDIGIYAPLGYVLTRKKTRDELIKAGRKQIAFSRSLGQAALRGLARRNDSTGDDTPRSDPATPPSSSEKSSRESEPTHTRPDAANHDAEAGTAPNPPEAVDAAEAADPAIDGYDDMTAKEIIALLGSASHAQVTWIQQQEMANKERVTVLRAADRRLGALA